MPPANPVPPPALRWLTYLLLAPLIALATSFFGILSLICGLWDKSAVSSMPSPAFGLRCFSGSPSRP